MNGILAAHQRLTALVKKYETMVDELTASLNEERNVSAGLDEALDAWRTRAQRAEAKLARVEEVMLALDKGRADGTVWTYGMVCRSLREALNGEGN